MEPRLGFEVMPIDALLLRDPIPRRYVLPNVAIKEGLPVGLDACHHVPEHVAGYYIEDGQRHLLDWYWLQCQHGTGEFATTHVRERIESAPQYAGG